jgi:PAS domain S-box-containing protein
MKRGALKDPKLQQQLSELQIRLSEAEDTLDAIRSGSVDALVVRTPRGEQLFTLKGADQTYRALVEAMNEGAVTLNRGIISYCNRHFARMTRQPLEKVFGTSIFELVPGAEFRQLIRDLEKGARERGSTEAVLLTNDGPEVPVLISASRFLSDNRASVCLIATDITDRKSAEQVRRELSRSILNAQEQERQRVARDLHDSVNQLLSSAKFRLSHVSPDCDPVTQDGIRQVQDLIEKAIAEVRLISRNLRPSELDDMGLPAALRSLAHDFEKRSGIAVRFRNAATRTVPASTAMAFYRIAQEALNNVEKHSRARRAELLLSCNAAEAELVVRDNGRGFRVRPDARTNSGWGLQNMQERAALVGGRLSIQSNPGDGTRISARFPLPPMRRNGHTNGA